MRTPAPGAARLCALAALLLAAALVGCQTGLPPEPLSVSGVVTAVDGPSVAEVDGFTLRTADGQTLAFAVETLTLDGGKPAPHLREHLLSGAPVTVWYQVEGDRLVALRYDDAR